MQCNRNLTLRRVRVTIVAVEKQFRVCVYSLGCPARNARAPCYIVICGLTGFSMFLHMI